MSGAWVCIVECRDGSFYTGLTKQDDPEARVWEHNNRVFPDSYTSSRLPVKLVYAEHFELVSDAIVVERRTKGWSRAKKVAMMSADWRQVQFLSRRRGGN